MRVGAVRHAPGVRAAALGALVLALASGCGDDEGDEEAPERQPAAPSPAAPPATGEENGPGGPQPGDVAPDPNPEDEPVDPEAEEPVRSEAVFTGRGGRISPSRVNVPPYIAVHVILESADGGNYQLSVEGETLAVGPDRRSERVQLDGLRPQDRYVATADGRRLVVSATAEPGP